MGWQRAGLKVWSMYGRTSSYCISQCCLSEVPSASPKPHPQLSVIPSLSADRRRLTNRTQLTPSDSGRVHVRDAPIMLWPIIGAKIIGRLSWLCSVWVADELEYEVVTNKVQCKLQKYQNVQLQRQLYPRHNGPNNKRRC